MKNRPLPIKNKNLKEKILGHCSRQEYAIFLDSNSHHNKYSRYRWLAAWGVKKLLTPEHSHFSEFQNFLDDFSEEWLFGHFSYDLKNEIENLKSQNADKIAFPALQFFVPEVVVYENEDGVFLESSLFQNESDFVESLTSNENPENQSIKLSAKTSQNEYLKTVKSLREELQFGNIYEVNYCIEWNTTLEKTQNFSPVSAFKKLNEKSKAPFSAFYKNDDQFLLCASPERYLQKSGNRLISQPMKGTAARFSDFDEDKISIQNLRESEKERAENVMITDLVRNDLGKTAKVGSVQVDDLFGIQSFENVHQMVSTVSSVMAEDCSTSESVKSTFPMGSMTGAPKVSAMNLIEKHETFARNLYAGAVGYISPNGDFDFNVVIRSLLYSAKNQFLTARVGSAITVHCDAEKEYEECLLKVKNLLDCLR